jgi:catechol 2,3-dioxygenase-like lactoylglutathione lyase family enzyme
VTDGATGSGLEKLTFVITTSRFDESLAFYRDLLGMRLVEEWSDFGHGAVLEALSGTVVELIDDAGARGLPAEERTVFMGLQVLDPDGVHDRLVAAGARVNGAPTPKPWGGRGFTAFDPDGMPVNVYTAYRTTRP